jgi:hypothetical protein
VHTRGGTPAPSSARLVRRMAIAPPPGHSRSGAIGSRQPPAPAADGVAVRPSFNGAGVGPPVEPGRLLPPAQACGNEERVDARALCPGRALPVQIVFSRSGIQQPNGMSSAFGSIGTAASIPAATSGAHAAGRPGRSRSASPPAHRRCSASARRVPVRTQRGGAPRLVSGHRERRSLLKRQRVADASCPFSTSRPWCRALCIDLVDAPRRPSQSIHLIFSRSAERFARVSATYSSFRWLEVASGSPK